MSYEDNRREYGSSGRDQEERHGHSGQTGRQQHQQQHDGTERKDNDYPSSGFRRDEFESYPPSRDEGNVNRGGYGRDAEGPGHGSGGHGSNVDDPESTGYDQPARNYNQRRQDNDTDNSYNSNSNSNRGGRNDNDSGRGGYGSNSGGRNEHSTQGGRQAVGSGESYVGLGHRGGDDSRATSDAYGGEGLTSGNDYGSNTHQNKPHHESNTGYAGGGAGGRGEHGSGGGGGGAGGYNSGGGGTGGYNSSGGGGGSTTGNSDNQGTYGSMDSGSNTAGSNLANWKPGQEMQFTAAEHETEANPFSKDATGYAGETQNFVKQGIKDVEKEIMGFVKDKIGGGSKH